MAITKEEREATIKKFARQAGDTGSPEVQVALITDRINDLNVHFKKNKQDNHSRRGLIALVTKRRTLLDYLKKKNLQSYQGLIKELGLRK
ncbi:MAG: 30S ribosomal protein S15 [Bdellovibrionales bacterium]